MLELKNIVKDYVNGTNVTHALKGISVNFRENEFVSILGASGCGKTTSLNIIGGLDKYTSGDLIINGKSTKKYTVRDWDTYRNHSIGFVFQNYNLIAHQNILMNVELALTIAGMPSKERKERALEALKKVGLEGMEKKKPSQLSGGQCQRVAIARALVNNPDILLADEPTGALDSETSVQIMDLLKEVASDRLVIMVTHNPELAEKYSTRIIKMSDGLLVSDSDPYEPNAKDKKKIVEETGKKSSMSVWTAAKLSLSNLGSKIRRTVLVTLAGSIGIIGVSAVLAVSQGVKDYIGSMQNDLLSSYPLSIAEESTDYTSLMTAFSGSTKKQGFEFDPRDPKVGVDSMVEYMMSAYKDITSIKTNTFTDELLAYIDQIPKDAIAAMSYKYGIEVTNNIFTDWKMKEDLTKRYSLNGLTQSYISELETVDGFSEYASYVSLFTNFFKKAPDSVDYVLDQYDVIAGETPTFADNELVVVVDQNTTLTDILLAELGYYDREEFINLAINSIDIQAITHDDTLTPEQKKEALEKIEDKTKHAFDYDEILSKKYYYYPQDTIYKEGMVDETKVVKTISCYDMTSYNYFNLEYDDIYNNWQGTIINSKAISSKPVVFTEGEMDFNVSELITFIQNLDFEGFFNNAIVKALMNYYKIDAEALKGVVRLLQNIDLSGINSFRVFRATDTKGNKYTLFASEESNMGIVMYSDATDTSKSYTSIVVNVSGNIIGDNIPPKGQYTYNCEVQPEWGNGYELKVKSILRLKEGKNFGCLERGIYFSEAFYDIVKRDSDHGKVTKALEDYIGSEEEKTRPYTAYMQYQYFMHGADGETLVKKKDEVFDNTGGLSILGFLSQFLGTDNSDSDIENLRSLCGKKAILTYDEDGETLLSKEFKLTPSSVSIYPASFEKKDVITNYLDKWNSDEVINLKVNGVDVALKPEQRDELNYTDTIQLIIFVINTLIDAVTAALIAFTSLSLLVSCFMIAVITYISIVERIKEIGVIRSLGGRKGDVANLFVMETLLTGLFSGIFGVAFTYVLEIIGNIIMVSLFGIEIAHLTVGTALIMVLVSVVLSVLSGLIPSQSAAHKDPVVALRSGE